MRQEIVSIEKAKLASIITDSTDLIQKVAELGDEVTNFKKQAEDATNEANKLKKQAEDLAKEASRKEAEFRQTMTKVANDWTDRGFLTAERRDQMVTLASENPSEALAAMNKIALRSSAEDFGKAAGHEDAGAGLDPVAAWAVSSE